MMAGLDWRDLLLCPTPRTGELFIESVDTLGNVEPLFFTLAESSPHHIADLPGHGEAVLSVAFSPEGILAVGADDGSVTLWNVATRQQITTLPKAEHWVEKVAFSPSGQASSGRDKGAGHTLDGGNTTTGRPFSASERVHLCGVFT